MGRLIVSTQVTVDGVQDQLDGWFDPEDESGQHGLEQLRAADAVVLGRETYEFLSEFWLHPVVWGDGVRAFQAGELPVRMRLIGARTFPSDVVQLSYAPVAR